MLLLFYFVYFLKFNTTDLKNFLLALIFLLFNFVVFAQLESPDNFLGYKIGTRFTPHYKIVEYFNYVANHSKMVALKKYGESNEHRPLLVAFVGTEAHISELEKIRTNNLNLARQGEAGMAGNTDAPAIVWLSYNVHGNEPTSSEAAMLTLFALTDPTNSETKEWLKNTIVAIDPCENPDGRDRYVNWYNSVVGNNFDPWPYSREHREPWPGGRTNHYNFDLNRDWAWQTQKESQFRSGLYNNWLPQVHIDLHEQGYNIPYFFPPAAEPYHDVITPWQRKFQVLVGNNNAKYFDKNHWLYFTHERFDLFYPSYGDTYPIYNGAIGFTYEQGGIGGGLGITTSDGDTLTLVERVAHHFTSSLSTIEVSSKNSKELITQFKKYFDDAVLGKTGEYKTYIIKYAPLDDQRIKSLKELLDKNKIVYGTSFGAGKGYNYLTKREENFNINKEDLVVSVLQPKSSLVQAFFEPNPRLSDSATYDITAWAMPYCYGLTAFASKQAFTVVKKEEQNIVKFSSQEPYGLIIPWEGGGVSKAVAQMVNEGITIRYSEKPFRVGENKFNRGSVVILKTGNKQFGDDWWKQVSNILHENGVTYQFAHSAMVDEGSDFGSDMFHKIKKPNVALLSGEGVTSYAMGEIWSYFDNELHYPIHLINSSDIGRINLSTIDVLVMADGRYDFLNNKEISEKLANWVSAGGKIVALEGAVKQLSKQSWSNLKPKADKGDSINQKEVEPSQYATREQDDISASTPGAIFKVYIDNTHPLMFGYPEYYYSLKMDGALYDPIPKGEGWNVGVLKSDKELAGFVGVKLRPNLKNGVLFAVQDLGRGNIIYLTDNVMFRQFWENGKLMLFNAVFLVGE